MDNAIIVDLKRYQRVAFNYIKQKKLNIISNNGLQILFEYKSKSKTMSHSRYVKNWKDINVPDAKLPKDIKHGVIRFVMLSDEIAYVDHTTSRLKGIKKYLTTFRVEFIEVKSGKKETDIDVRKRVLSQFIPMEINDKPNSQLIPYEKIKREYGINIPILGNGVEWYPDYINVENNSYIYQPSNSVEIDELAKQIITGSQMIMAERDTTFKLKYGMNDTRSANVIIDLNNYHFTLKVELILLLIKYYCDNNCVNMKVII